MADVDVNAFGQPVGPDLRGWTARPLPVGPAMQGRFCRLRPLSSERFDDDSAALFDGFRQAPDGRDWTYMASGPFTDLASYREYLGRWLDSTDPLCLVVEDVRSGRAVGSANLMRTDCQSGVTEIGSVSWTPAAQRTPVTTEAIYFMLRRAFDDAGYRRVEWKCDALNERSRVAALRFGFRFEGIFRQAVVYKGRNRDTAWFAIIDRDWSMVRAAFEAWLAPANFRPDGSQVETLARLRQRVDVDG